MNADKTLLTPLCKRLGATLSRRGMLFVGLGIVIIMSVAALLAPWLSPYDPTALHLKSILVPPSAQFPLGTDALGRDVLSRLLYGARVSLWVGFVSVSISIAIGIALGLLAGYFRGIVDEIIMRGVDVMLCFPSFFLILAVIAFLEPSLNTIMVVIGLTSWMGVARLVRAETLSLRERDFVAAARLAGTRPFRIMVMHILPNALTPVLVSATLGIAGNSLKCTSRRSKKFLLLKAKKNSLKPCVRSAACSIPKESSIPARVTEAVPTVGGPQRKGCEGGGIPRQSAVMQRYVPAVKHWYQVVERLLAEPFFWHHWAGRGAVFLTGRPRVGRGNMFRFNTERTAPKDCL